MALAAFVDQPDQRNDPLFVNQADDQQQAVTPNFATVKTQPKFGQTQTGNHLNEGQKVALVRYVLILVEPMNEFHPTGKLGPTGLV